MNQNKAYSWRSPARVDQQQAYRIRVNLLWVVFDLISRFAHMS